MATPDAIAAAIAQFCENVTGLRTVTDPTTLINPPVAGVFPAQGTFIDYLLSMEHGVVEMNWRVVVLVSRANDRASLPKLYQYLAPGGSNSIPSAILADPTLGHTVDYCTPVEATGPEEISWAGIDYLGAQIMLQTGTE
jgi:hypothetical protein